MIRWKILIEGEGVKGFNASNDFNQAFKIAVEKFSLRESIIRFDIWKLKDGR